MVIVGGYNVYPREIDEVLFNHPAIHEAATVGKRDDRLGEVVVAFVALKNGAELGEEVFFAQFRPVFQRHERHHHLSQTVICACRPLRLRESPDG